MSKTPVSLPLTSSIEGPAIPTDLQIVALFSLFGFVLTLLAARIGASGIEALGLFS
jgi:hypothetical protein